MSIPALSRAERKAAQRARLRAELPELATLIAALATVFGNDDVIHVVQRRANEYASSFPSEIVTCQREDRRVVQLLCKYEAGQRHNSHGHRADVAYEASVYRRILEPLGMSTAKWYGASTNSPSGESWLVIEYVEGAVRVADSPEPLGAMQRAARWIGRFHAANALHVSSAATAFVRRYDAGYYRDWARRTATLAAGMHSRFPWLSSVCVRFGRCIDPLLTRSTVIHGEYGPMNVLVRGDRVCPVDWESTAIGAGEIDLAALTDGRWMPDLVTDCEREYASARWPAGLPADFERTLELARLYWNFRWLGDRAEWTASAKGRQRLERVKALAERLELI